MVFIHWETVIVSWEAVLVTWEMIHEQAIMRADSFKKAKEGRSMIRRANLATERNIPHKIKPGGGLRGEDGCSYKISNKMFAEEYQVQSPGISGKPFVKSNL